MSIRQSQGKDIQGIIGNRRSDLTDIISNDEIVETQYLVKSRAVKNGTWGTRWSEEIKDHCVFVETSSPLKHTLQVIKSLDNSQPKYCQWNHNILAS